MLSSLMLTPCILAFCPGSLSTSSKEVVATICDWMVGREVNDRDVQNRMDRMVLFQSWTERNVPHSTCLLVIGWAAREP